MMAIAPSLASAQATRTWVSGVGDDVNPCSRTAPCKTFAGAISKTATNGEINCLDSAGFGAVTITKSITIDCHAEHGGILSLNTNGVIINGAGAVVTLRGLVINGAGGTTGNGVRILNAAAVNIDDCIIEYFGGTGTNGRGVTIETTVANVVVSVTNSQLYNLTNFGIHSTPTAGNVQLTVDNTQILRGLNSAVAIINLTSASISNSVLSHNGGAGVALQNANTTASVNNSTISFNAFGIANGLAGASTTRLSGNLITANGNGLRIDSGSVFSYGNNSIRGNAGNETPTAPSLGQQ
jgi:hypothetical protein